MLLAPIRAATTSLTNPDRPVPGTVWVAAFAWNAGFLQPGEVIYPHTLSLDDPLAVIAAFQLTQVIECLINRADLNARNSPRFIEVSKEQQIFKIW